ncbi:ATF5 isoform 3 [Pongo abelii]|uniref:ATF5 isoform 3 n=1 Tax=Pongo abelii TaxID=9601 RepID=A0A2J8U8P2_PONAB|nr:ATF5 isoform 3 [Pongo abelii]
MSLLATLGLELDRALLPASGLGWLVDYGKLPPAPAPLAPYEVLGGALEGRLPVGGELLAGKGRWKVELGSGGQWKMGEEELIHVFSKY